MRALVVIDYQSDFVTGTLGSQDAVLIGDAIGSLISSYLDYGDQVFFTRDTHDPDYLDTREGRLLPVTHCQQLRVTRATSPVSAYLCFRAPRLALHQLLHAHLGQCRPVPHMLLKPCPGLRARCRRTPALG